MIAHLRGKLLAKHPNQAIVETGGVGYDVTISVPTFSEMPGVGGEVAFHIHTQVREDIIALYGFLRLADKNVFEKLLTVSGIGPWTWSCAGSNGGTTAQCSANITPSSGATSGGTPITIGETKVASVNDGGNGNLLLAQKATLSQTATLQSLSFYVRTTGGKLRLGVYDATGASGGPGQLKATTNSFTPVVGWNTQPVITPVSLLAGTYWLAYLDNNDNLHYPTQLGVGNFKSGNQTFGPLPTTFPVVSISSGGTWAFYATLSVP